MAPDPYRYFRIEAREIVDGLGRIALELERGPVRAEAVVHALRMAHTLKGAARVVRLPAIADLAHQIEDLLAPYRDGGDAVPVGPLLAHLDAIGRQVTALDAPTRAVVEEGFETVRVPMAELDRVQERLAECSIQLSAILSSVADHDLQVPLERLARDWQQLQDAVIGLRLVPASVIFAPLERAVRDAAQEVGREVSFSASGGETRLEGRVITGLRDALLHLVRNAVAHGIEPTDERLARGKPAAGSIALHVERHGAEVCFRCSDDGRGLNLAAVQEAATKAGRARPANVEQAVALLTKGGLSTQGDTTIVAGRGVGMSTAASIVERLHGRMLVQSETGRGLTVTVMVPLSLSSLSVLTVESGGEVHGLPVSCVVQAQPLERLQMVQAPEGQSVLTEGESLRFVPLSAVVGAAPAGSRIGVEIRAGARRGVLGVERLRGVHVTTMRPVPRSAGTCPLVLGVGLDLHGQIQVVLEPAALLAALPQVVPQASEPLLAPPRVLVIDDSLTTRMLEQSILEAAGYPVQLASNAEEGLQMAIAERFGAILVDVEMPGMDGFEFVGRARSLPVLRDVPVIMVTSRNAPEDRQRGAALGVDGYMVKSEFDQGVLLDLVRRLAR